MFFLGEILKGSRRCSFKVKANLWHSKFKITSNEYQQYLIARGYKPHKVSKQFSDVAKISRGIAQQPRVKMDFNVSSFLTEFNPLLLDLNKLIRNRLPLLNSDPKMKRIFPEK